MNPGGYSNGTELFDASIQITDAILQTTGDELHIKGEEIIKLKLKRFLCMNHSKDPGPD